MVDNNDILNAIAEIVEEVLGIDSAEVSAETSFTDDLDVDSLAMMEIAVAVEDRFEVKIPDDRVTGLRTVGDAVNYVAAHR
ncbi:acyl carrier protein [Kitasatospora sp. NPDC057940]|uniref:acyl carrier protein n=1 Tax=Kitasatospora sp. NPDC057940 TaxID=3346285 RepID=UPI0036DF70A9